MVSALIFGASASGRWYAQKLGLPPAFVLDCKSACNVEIVAKKPRTLPSTSKKVKLAKKTLIQANLKLSLRSSKMNA